MCVYHLNPPKCLLNSFCFHLTIYVRLIHKFIIAMCIQATVNKPITKFKCMALFITTKPSPGVTKTGVHNVNRLKQFFTFRLKPFCGFHQGYPR